MQRKSLIIFYSILLGMMYSHKLHAQLTYVKVDSLSIVYTNNKQWLDLLDLQKQAKKQDISYPNLNYRACIAHYYLNKPRKAAFELEKLERINPFAPYIKNYRLLSYAGIGMQNEAWAVSRKLNADQRKTLGVAKYKGIQSINIDGGIRFYSDTSLYKPLGMANVSLLTMLGRGYASMTNQYGFVNINAYFGKIYQHQFYTSFKIPLTHGLNIEPAFHLVSYTVKSIDNTFETYTDQDFAASFRLSWNHTFTELQATQTWLGLYGTNKWQSELGLKIYPLQNNKLTLHFRTIISADSTYANINPIYLTDIYGLPVKWLETGIWYHHVNHAIFSENNLQILNNSFDLTRYKTGVYFRFYPGKGFSPMIYYMFERRRELIQYTPYFTHTLGISLQYSF